MLLKKSLLHINPITYVKKVIFRVSYKTFWSWGCSRSRNSDLRLHGAGAERNIFGIFSAPQQWFKWNNYRLLGKMSDHLHLFYFCWYLFIRCPVISYLQIPVLLFCTLQVRPLWRPSSACSRISVSSGARSSSARRSSSSGSSGRSYSSSSTGCGSAIVRQVRGGALAYPNESVFEERLFLWIYQGCGSGSPRIPALFRKAGFASAIEWKTGFGSALKSKFWGFKGSKTGAVEGLWRSLWRHGGWKWSLGESVDQWSQICITLMMMIRIRIPPHESEKSVPV